MDDINYNYNQENKKDDLRMNQINEVKKPTNHLIVIFVILCILLIFFTIIFLLIFYNSFILQKHTISGTNVSSIIPQNIELGISSAQLVSGNKSINILVSRKGSGSLSGMTFMFFDNFGNQFNYSTLDFPLDGQERSYIINSEMIGQSSFSNIKLVLVSYQSGSEVKSSSTASISASITNSTKSKSTTSSSGGGGGGSSGGGGGTPTCSPSKTCTDYPGQCGVSLSDGCSNSLNCITNCASGQSCNSSGQCVIQNNNLKLMSKYSSKEVFLISDKNWKDVLPLVPLTTWSGNENCQKGYGTPQDVCIYPTLIWHEENNSFDADSIIYFMQQYSPTKITIIGNISSELNNLLITAPSLGAGLNSNQLQKITTNDYFSYWQNYSSIVYVEDNYELALSASSYASLINSPLVIKNTSSDVANVFINKKVICVGNVIPSGSSCNESYSLEPILLGSVCLKNNFFKFNLPHIRSVNNDSICSVLADFIQIYQ